MLIVKIPSSQGGLGKANGSEKAPEKIINEIKNFYLSESFLLPTVQEMTVAVTNSNIEETNKQIEKTALEAFNISQIPVYLGGDHSITYPIMRAFSKKYPKNPGIIIFDAHPDAENDFMPPTQEDLLPALLSQKLVKPQNIILIGTRNMDLKELDFIRKHKIMTFPMNMIEQEGISEVMDIVMENARKWSDVYVSIDIDVVDPAFAPGTGYREPGGLTSRELIAAIHKLKFLKHIKGFDLVEINPDKDLEGMTSKLGAKLLVELI